MRLIDADALIEVLNDNEVPYNADVNYFVINAPTIDAVSIVRCKNCKWAEPNEFNDYDCRCHIPIFRVNANGFCSYGERMKGADDGDK